MKHGMMKSFPVFDRPPFARRAFSGHDDGLYGRETRPHRRDSGPGQRLKQRERMSDKGLKNGETAVNAESGIDVLVFGHACLDYLIVVDRFPEEDSKVSFLDRIMEGGGQGSTGACCIARLGGRVAYIGGVGDDEEGRFCLLRLRDFGVDTSFVKVIPGWKTPVAHIVVTRERGTRTIIYEHSGMPVPGVDSATDGLVKKAPVILLGPRQTYLAKTVKSMNPAARVVYDCERSREGLEDAMECADYFVASSAFFTDDAARERASSLEDRIRWLRGLVRGECVVTDGINGAYYFKGGALFRVPAPSVEVRDTTGAGDNFHAAFALCVSRGCDLDEAVRFAVTVASLSCRAYGSRNGIPVFDEALEVAEKLPLTEIG